MNKLINYKGLYKTAPVTPGLLKVQQEKKNPAYGRHQLSRLVQIIGFMPPRMGFFAKKKQNIRLNVLTKPQVRYEYFEC